MQMPISNAIHIQAQTTRVSIHSGKRYPIGLTMSRDTRKHDMELCAVRVVCFPKEFVICDVPCGTCHGNGMLRSDRLTYHKEDTAIAITVR